MIYKSNLEAPDLSRFFKHLTVSPMAHSFGHDVPRDWADKSDDDPVFGIWKRCGFWTHDEAAILYNVAQRVNGFWLDMGIESVWAVLKRGLHGVYHHASKKHIGRYVDEFSWRLNAGNVARHTLQRLDSFVDCIVGKRLTYKRLTAEVTA